MNTVKDPDDQPASSPNALEKGDFPAPGEETSGGGGTNHRDFPTPSKASAGGRGIENVKGVIGDGRGSSPGHARTMGDGEVTLKYKGTMGC